MQEAGYGGRWTPSLRGMGLRDRGLALEMSSCAPGFLTAYRNVRVARASRNSRTTLVIMEDNSRRTQLHVVGSA